MAVPGESFDSKDLDWCSRSAQKNLLLPLLRSGWKAQMGQGKALTVEAEAEDGEEGEEEEGEGDEVEVDHLMEG